MAIGRESGREGEGVKEGEGSIQTAPAYLSAASTWRGKQAGDQEVAGRVRARRGHTPLSSCREVEDDWHWPVGWAGLLGHWARLAAQCQAAVTQVSFSFCFLFYFSAICLV